MEEPCGIFHEVSLLVLPDSQRPYCRIPVPSKEMSSSTRGVHRLRLRANAHT